MLLGCGHGGGASAPESPTPTTGRRPSGPPPAPVQSRSLEALLGANVGADSAFPWSATRRLTWRDFRGRPPAPGDGDEVAKTAYALFYAWKCKDNVFDFRAIAAFRPRQSWVKAVVLSDTVLRRSTLGHEQTHFDLAEVHARSMARYFAALANACRKTDDELTNLAGLLIQDEKAEQQRYDAETDHGLRSDKQAEWTAEVARQLGRQPRR